MNKYLICIVVIIISTVLFSCNKEIVEQEKSNVINPIDSIGSFFVKAEKIAGEGIALYLISGVQVDRIPNLSYNMNWTLFFVKGNRIIKFTMTQGKTEVSDKTPQELAIGYEYIYKNDERLKSILSPKIVWDLCLQKYNKKILNIEVFAPLLAKKSNFIYRFYSKEGYNQLGVNYFVFSAKSGDDLTNQ